ncbi:DeoR/GlpR family DNA-binding transcription regulator [Flavobacterium branchiicola]|uniref:DeoR/GlpR family DNA-binding transcription regulator n=1 Tax=Flavobacterium branchiicola TaxID=1114875 RepID=A0ABV9PH01_9FLAO|nr:DeoR/GlpR family DNA-binding transcription regulator [Flavobacterium branchiicola]MBS7255815.1 DeoR/GlpR transcriptional regulator [Flavobacterium branchiicola]
MLKKERHQFILGKFNNVEKINTIDLALELNISEDTIRRDFNELHNKGLIDKVYGGAFLVKDKSKNVFDITIINEDKKMAVGKKALSFLSEGQVIIMSGGTTNLSFCKLIPIDFTATIYTYSLPIAMQLSQHPNIELIFIGGKLQKKAMVTIGIDVVQVLSKIKADVCFLGVSSLDVNQGLTEMGYEVSVIKKEMINASNKIIVLATSDKINGTMPHKVCGLDKIDAIVTELNPKSPKIKKFVDSGAKMF